VRVVPNLYPALERQEVVIHSPRHVRSFAELEDEEVERVAVAWRERSRSGRGYLHAILNEGREAGGSLPHSHSQLVWLDEEPPAVAAETGLEHLLEGERVLERDGLVLLSPYAARLPYELLIAPLQSEGHGFESELLAPSLLLLRDAIRRLQAVAGTVPLNAWLHDSGRWHLELLPRLATPAGLELGAGIWVNTVAPEDAAAELRSVEP
jgi:UDPglucose--hexose-1-phosphate uridylyltransferase